MRFLTRVRESLSISGVRDFFSAPPEIADPDQLRRTLGRLILMRVTIISLILGAKSYELLTAGQSGSQGTRLLFLAIAATFAISLINALHLKFTTNPARAGYLQLFLDVVLATLAIEVSNSTVSIVLYLLIIVAAAMVFSRFGAVIIAALCGVGWAALSSGLLSWGLLGSSIPRSSPSEILGVYTALIGVALVSGYIARQREIMGMLADTNAQHLSDLNERQRQLFDDISDGIITLDLESAITGLNQAARTILGLSELEHEHFLGRPVTEVLTEQGIAGVDRLLGAPSGAAQSEITLKNKRSDGEIRLNCSLRPMSDRNGREVGRMVLFSDISHVRSIEERLNLHEQMVKLLAEKDDESPSLFDEDDLRMIGESGVMKRVFLLVERIAASEASVLVTGESGTGKELIAKAIHSRSSRSANPFVAINCGAIPENLIESELFGHKKGSFTGAVADNPGLFRQAHGGTIFLDEIGELPPQMQTKLLRVLQERMIRAVGDTKDVPVDVRVVAATNRDLKKEIKANAFREDLYYRLNVVNVVVPPLRERKEDIPHLVRHFISQYCDEDRVLPQVSPEAIQLLMGYAFPGNIRELENVIERALVLGGQAILPEHLPDEVISGQRRDDWIAHASVQLPSSSVDLPVDLELELAKLEQLYLHHALEQSGGVKKHAAELLGLNFRSFRYRLKKYGLGDSTAADGD